MMTYEQIEAFLQGRGYLLDGLHVEEIEVLAGYEGFTYDAINDKFRYRG